MGYSLVTVTEGQSVDSVSPGAPAFTSITQSDNHSWEVQCALPMQDADGSELTGMTKLTVCTLPMTDGTNPFIGLSMDECLGLPAVVAVHAVLSPSDVGALKTVQCPVMNLGGWQAFAAAVSDSNA